MVREHSMREWFPFEDDSRYSVTNKSPISKGKGVYCKVWASMWDIFGSSTIWTEVLRTPSLTQPGFELISSISWHYVTETPAVTTRPSVTSISQPLTLPLAAVYPTFALCTRYPLWLGLTEAVWNTKLARHLYTWPALGIKPPTFWSWVQCSIHFTMCFLISTQLVGIGVTRFHLGNQ